MFVPFDYHIHSSYSSDSEAPTQAMIDSAIEKGFQEIAFTEHLDYDYPNSKTEFLLDIESYMSHLFALRQQYNGKIKVQFGIEIGLQPHINRKNKAVIASYPFDFIIGSTHNIQKKDPYYGVYFQGKTKNEAYEEYLLEVLSNCKDVTGFQVCGHLDYIVRYAAYEDSAMLLNDHEELFREIFKELIETGRGIELNTSTLRKGYGHRYPYLDILKLYRSLGGEIITLGSDAHTPKEIGGYFEQGRELLLESGFQAITIFDEKKPQYIEIR